MIFTIIVTPFKQKQLFDEFEKFFIQKGYYFGKIERNDVGLCEIIKNNKQNF